MFTELYPFDKEIFVIRFRPGLYHPKFLIDIQQQKSCFLQPSSPLPPLPPPPQQPTPLSPWISCGLLENSRFDRRSFQLQSPNYPLPYEPNLNCVSKVIRANANICKLQIRFNDFQLENSYKCQNDFLEINGVKLCGDLPIGTISKSHFYYYPPSLFLYIFVWKVSSEQETEVENEWSIKIKSHKFINDRCLSLCKLAFIAGEERLLWHLHPSSQIWHYQLNNKWLFFMSELTGSMD